MIERREIYKIYNLHLVELSQDAYEKENKSNSTLYFVINENKECVAIYLGSKQCFPADISLDDVVAEINDLISAGLLISSLSEQTLSTDQQTQARQNIGALASNEIDTIVVHDEDNDVDYHLQLCIENGKPVLSYFDSLADVSKLKRNNLVVQNSDWEYIILDDGTLQLTKYIGKNTNLIVPNRYIINDTLYTVSCVGSNIPNEHMYYSLGYESVLDNYRYNIMGTLLDSTIESVTISDGVSIGKCCFSRCIKLANVTFSGSTSYVDDCAFYGCSKLKGHIIFPNGLKTCGSDIITNSGVTSITLPESVETIGAYAFTNLGLRASDDNNYIGLDNIYFNCKNAKITYFSHKIDENSEEIRIVPSFAYAKNIVFGETVEKIPDYICCKQKFENGIEISDNVKVIGKYAFSKMEDVVNRTFLLGNSIQRIEEGAFDKTYISNIEIANGDQIPYTIASDSQNNTYLYSVKLDGNIDFDNPIAKIKDKQFTSSKYLESESRNISNFEYTILDDTHISIDGLSLKGILNNKFNKKDLKINYEYEIDGRLYTVVKIGDWAFSSLDTPNAINAIKNNKSNFSNDEDFKKLMITNRNIKSIIIPTTVTEIGNNSFAVIHGTISQWFVEKYKDNDNFKSLINKSNSFSANDGDDTSSLQYIYGLDNVETVGKNAFLDSYKIEFLYMPKAREIGAYAFRYMGSLKSIILNKNLTEIPTQCFAACYSLNSVVTDVDEDFNELTIIYDYAFILNRNLRKFKIVPGKIKYIGNYAFYGCGFKFDWQSLKGCTFQTLATRLQNFSSTILNYKYEIKPCNYYADYIKSFSQMYKLWYYSTFGADNYMGPFGCTWCAFATAYNAFNKTTYNPVEIIQMIREESEDLANTGVTWNPEYLEKYTYLNIKISQEINTYSIANIQRLYDELAEGNLIMTSDTHHAHIIYGIAHNGDLLIADSLSSTVDSRTGRFGMNYQINLFDFFDGSDEYDSDGYYVLSLKKD